MSVSVRVDSRCLGLFPSPLTLLLRWLLSLSLMLRSLPLWVVFARVCALAVMVCARVSVSACVARVCVGMETRSCPD